MAKARRYNTYMRRPRSLRSYKLDAQSKDMMSEEGYHLASKRWSSLPNAWDDLFVSRGVPPSTSRLVKDFGLAKHTNKHGWLICSVAETVVLECPANSPLCSKLLDLGVMSGRRIFAIQTPGLGWRRSLPVRGWLLLNGVNVTYKQLN